MANELGLRSLVKVFCKICGSVLIDSYMCIMNVIEFGLLDFVAGAFFPSQQSFYNENARSGRLGDDHLREMHPVSQSPPKWF